MNSRMPPFKSIEAFVIAARTLSFTEAASQLCITVPAISRRIQALEAELGLPLFRRTHRTIELTGVGESYYSDLAPALERIRSASERIRETRPQHLVRISVPGELAASWLVPRLPHFHARHRHLHVELESLNGEGTLPTGDADLAIRLGTGDWPGLRAERLLDAAAYPVCSAEFLNRNLRPRTAAELVQLPLLGISSHPDLWPEWLRVAAVQQTAEVQHVFDSFQLLYSAAACGQGVALGIDVLVRPYLDGMRLMRLLNADFKLSRGYYVLCPTDARERGAVATFRQWLKAEAAGYAAAAVQ